MKLYEGNHMISIIYPFDSFITMLTAIQAHQVVLVMNIWIIDKRSIFCFLSPCVLHKVVRCIQELILHMESYYGFIYILKAYTIRYIPLHLNNFILHHGRFPYVVESLSLLNDYLFSQPLDFSRILTLLSLPYFELLRFMSR